MKPHEKQSKVQGEGDYEAGRRFDKAEEDFVKSGKAEDAGRKAEPRDEKDEAEMAEAERIGKSHSKGEAPADKGSTQKP